MQFPINLFLAGTIVILAWILNLSTICAMRYLHSNTTIVYGFLSSLCLANLFMATIDFPPSIISNVIVSKSLQHVFCVSWTYLDTLLCNVAILHLLGSSLDCYLRLHHKVHYMKSTKHVLTCMKLSAPWTLSFVQSTAFMTIAQMSETTLTDDICVISDPNLLILRSIMCFGIPISSSAVLIFLSAKSLKNIEQLEIASRNVPCPDIECQYESFQLFPSSRPNQMTRDDPEQPEMQSSVISTKSIPVNNILNFYQHQCPRHGVLSLPLTQTMPMFDLSMSSRDLIYECCPHYQHCPDLIPIRPFTDSSNQSKVTNTQSSIGGITDCQVTNASIPPSLEGLGHEDRIEKTKQTGVRLPSLGLSKCAVEKKTHERTAVAMNLTICIFSILMWGPFIIGSLIQGVCKPPHCLLPVSNTLINDFKWISYSLCIVYPIIFIVIDSNIRAVIKSSMLC